MGWAAFSWPASQGPGVGQGPSTDKFSRGGILLTLLTPIDTLHSLIAAGAAKGLGFRV